MSTLRDQLLKAGLASEKQSKDAERRLRQQQRERQQLPKDKRGMASEAERAAQQAQLAKTARDQELNRRRNEEAERKARQAEIVQLVEQNRLPRAQTDELYNFVDGNKIRRIPADTSVRDGLSRGAIAIVRCNDRYELVPTEIAARIRERDESAVIVCGVAQDSAGTNTEGYEDFVIPEDLKW
jgi:uncharacterized protein YaiL (DUF2058 family)